MDEYRENNRHLLWKILCAIPNETLADAAIPDSYMLGAESDPL
jgi:hypothetical protein